MGRTGRRKPRPGNPNDPEGLAVAVGRFQEWMRTRAYSPSTVEDRGQQIDCFIAWAEERGITRPAEVTHALITRYQRHLVHYRKMNDAPLGLLTQQMRIVAVRVFFKWLARQGHILFNPASEIELPRVGKRLPQAVLTAEEAERVLSLPDLDDPVQMRDRAIMETLYSTGMRRAEIRNLRLTDIDHERGVVFIRQGKGNKDRVVPIGDRALGWIGKYTHEVRPLFVKEPDEGFVFLLKNGNRVSIHQLTTRTGRYVRAAEIGKPGACHLFRHTCATLMLEHGADVRFIQALLGHATLETTEVYTRVSIRKPKEVHTATHPAAHLRRPAHERQTPCAPLAAPERLPRPEGAVGPRLRGLPAGHPPGGGVRGGRRGVPGQGGGDGAALRGFRPQPHPVRRAEEGPARRLHARTAAHPGGPLRAAQAGAAQHAVQAVAVGAVQGRASCQARGLRRRVCRLPWLRAGR